MFHGNMKALYLFAWSHFLRRTGIHFAGKCSSFFCSHFRTENRIPLFLKVL